MCSGYSVQVGGEQFLTSESLYQVCRYNEFCDIQRMIQSEKSLMSSKINSKKYISNTRSDWDDVRVDNINQNKINHEKIEGETIWQECN